MKVASSGCAASRMCLCGSLLAAMGSVAFGQTGGAAKVQSLAGQVSVLKDSSPWALNPGDTVQPQQIIITGPDGYAVFRVADGSTFNVFPNARVVFRSNRSDWKDLLEVLLGKVKVQIEHFGGQPNNNKVRTATAVIAVRGTIFDVDVEDDDATTLVLVEEGKVEVSHLLEPGKSLYLSPGEWVRVFKNQPLAAKSMDRGAALQRLMRAASDALNEVLVRGTHGPAGTGASGSGGGTGPNGDKSGTPAPSGGTPPPAPPPPASPQ